MKKKVSVVIPVYNVERYLRQCIESVLAQKLKDIEIILVDDGSTDGSPAIVDEYAKKDGRIVAIHQKNRGYSATVNLGIKKARGEYIGIVESDDFIDPTMYEKLYKKATKYDADIVKCMFYKYDSTNAEPDKIFVNPGGVDLRKAPEGCFSPSDWPQIVAMHSSVWAAVYKGSFIKKIKIPESAGASYQDLPFMMELMTKAEKICAVKEPLLHWRNEPGQVHSTSANGEKSLLMAKNTLLALEILQKSGKFEALKDGFFAQAIWTNSNFFFRIQRKYREKYYNLLRKIFEPADKTVFSNPLLRPEDKMMIRSIMKNRGSGAVRRAYTFGGLRRRLASNTAIAFIKRHKLPFAMLALLLAWSPYLISAYPGIVTFDQGWSILQFFGSGSLPITTDDPTYLGHFIVDHKPFLFTIILGSFIKIGGFLGSQNLGLFALVIAQSVLMAYVIALLIRKLWRGGLRRFSAGAFVCLAILPIIPMHLASPTNDNIFAALFLWWLIILFDVVKNRGASPMSRRQLIKLLILSILLPLFKKAGLFIVLATFIVLLIAKSYRRIRKQIAIIIGAIVASSVFVSLVVYPVMDIIPGGKQEALGIVLHQTSAYVSQYSDSISPDEKESISGALNYDCILNSYDENTHDTSKRCYRFGVANDKLIKYLAVWAGQGMRHPLTYLSAWWSIAKNYIVGTQKIDSYINVGDSIETTLAVIMGCQQESEYVTDVTSKITLHTPNWALSMRSDIQKSLEAIFSGPLEILVSGSFYVTWIPIACFVIILIYKRKWLLLFVPIVLTMSVAYISPVYLMRYYLPMYLIAPLLIGVTISALKGRSS